MVLKRVLFSCLFLLSFNTYGYSIFSLERINWDRIDEVDVLVAGYGPEMGGLFMYSALTQARYLRDKSPSNRTQLILWAQEKSPQAHQRDLEQRNLIVLASNNSPLTTSLLERQLMALPSVSSLHIFSHSGAHQGISLQSGERRLDENSLNWSRLRSKFTDGAYVFLHGCNNAFITAPRISNKLQRPVFGSLTGTDFQEIYSDKRWYTHNPGQFPSGMSKLTWNDFIFNGRFPCWMGYCHRMKPDNITYRGTWGRYETGLPFYRPFCNYGQNRGDSQVSSDCLRGIANGLRSWPVNPRMSSRDRVVDFVCPKNASRSTRRACENYLAGRSNQRIYSGKTLNCTLNGCDYRMVRSTRPNGQSIQVFDGDDHGNAPFRSAYDLFMRALNSF